MAAVPPPPLTHPLLLRDGKSTLGWADWYTKVAAGITIGAPSDGPYVVTKATADLTAPTNLAALPNGFVTSASAGGEATITTTAIVPVAAGGTGLSPASLQNGQLLVGRASDNTFQLNTITAGLGMAVTNGPASVTLSTTGTHFAISTPGNPTGTVSTTGVMMGLALSFTPLRTGQALVIVTSAGANTAATGGVRTQLRFGTGSAPANGSAPTGSAGGNPLAASTSGASDLIPFSNSTIISGLTIGTPIWGDVELSTIAAGTASIASITAMFIEI